MVHPARLSWFGLIGSVALNTCLGAQPQPPYRSPVVGDDGRITFRIRLPQAAKVELTGPLADDVQKKIRGEDGVWVIVTKPVPPDIYTYAFTVDGVRTLDAQNPWLKYWKTADNLVEIAGDPPALFAERDVPHGTLHVVRYSSKSLGMKRRMHVYTPPGYEDDTTRRYPVLYLCHGFGDDDATWTALGRAHFTLDNLIAEGKAVPMVVVMPYGHATYRDRPPPTGGARLDRSLYNMRAVSDDILQDIKPLVESRYRVETRREKRAVAGLSMGGGQSYHLGLNHSDHFAWIGAFSAAVYARDHAQGFPAVAADAARLDERLRLLWIACGRSDFLFRSNKEFTAWLAKKGVEHRFVETDGGHDWSLWRNEYLPSFLQLVFREAAETPATTTPKTP